MTTSNLKQKIDNALSRKPSLWMDKALRDELYEVWLERSADIALHILGVLQAIGMSQKELAEKTGVSPQQVSKLLKGNENLTLETIAKLEVALGIVLIVIPKSVSGTEAELNTAQVQKRYASRMRETKTLPSAPQSRAVEKVYETETGYGKKARKKETAKKHKEALK